MMPRLVIVAALACVGCTDELRSRDVLVTLRSPDASIVGRTQWSVAGRQVAIVGVAVDEDGGEVTLEVDPVLCGDGARAIGDVLEHPDVPSLLFVLRASDCSGETEATAVKRGPSSYYAGTYCPFGDGGMCSTSGVQWCYSEAKDHWYTKGTCTR